MVVRRSRGYSRQVLGISIGLLCGFFLATWLRLRWVPSMKTCHDSNIPETGIEMRTLEPPDTGRNFIFVGVMTAKKYLSTRASAVNRTWAKTVPGKVVFFSSADSNSSLRGLPLVSLPGVDDSYPPQKKSFMMLKYMHDNFIDKYEWFMRADDDVYLRGDKLETFLRSVNSSQRLFIGQAGLGNEEEFGKLYFNHGENFCMGGPGMIFSRETLRKIVPNISHCLKNLYSTHEDVEVGRCVKKFAGVDCTWSYEMQQLFYHKYFAKDAFTGNLHTSEVHKAITLHPIKSIPHFHRLHSYLESQRIAYLQLKTLRTLREINEMNRLLKIPLIDDRTENTKLGSTPDLVRYMPNIYDETIAWDFFTKSLYSLKYDTPKRGLDKTLQVALEDIVLQVMEMINRNSLARGRTIDYQEILYGYRRIIPTHGVDYILDLLLMYRRHKGKKRNVPVRRHAYLQQSFGKIQFIEELTNDVITKPASDVRSANSLTNFANGVSSGAFGNVASVMYSKQTIHFVLPLAGRFETLKRFMQNFERTCLVTKEDVKLVVVLFKTAQNDQSLEIIKLISHYQELYPNSELRILSAMGEFARGLALELGASQYPSDALLFFVDVDIHFSSGFLYRCRKNTKQGKLIYYPEVFSQYEPRVVYPHKQTPVTNILINKQTGFFRHYGFGIVCVYNSDVSSVGGMDASIVGWGLEDVDLYNKFVISNMTVFRSPDVGLVHIYHPVICDEALEPKQYQMCLGSRTSTYGSPSQLSNIIQNSKHKHKETSKT
uniref:Hexosyltransferase n=1 Tax=Saccoglossus kowalevskii TaxID=10224 RepID=A0ABM0GZ03_SACKO|nr:PREDICTED: chondroitin sulfate synthase 1-like [Saccoglossus kowalevskii]